MRRKVWRYIIQLIGLLLILYSTYLMCIGVFGSDTVGIITSYRRIMGERDEVNPNRYTYSLGYKFYINEKEYSGHSTLIASPLYIKADGTGLIEIMYIKQVPSLNALKKDTTLDSGKLALILMGSFLIYSMNIKKK